MRMLLFILLFCMSFSGLKAQTNLIEMKELAFISPVAFDSILLETTARIEMVPHDCPNLLGYGTSRRSDTLYIDLYYGLSITAGLGSCVEIDTLYLGGWKDMSEINIFSVLPHATNREGTVPDTTAMPPARTIHRSLTVADATVSADILDVFPNPASARIHFRTSKEITWVQVQDIHGRAWIEKAGDQDQLDISGLPNGIYLLKLATPGGIYWRRVVKQ